ncbi:MAG: copper resistance CopC/CopD family protein [bacterium]
MLPRPPRVVRLVFNEPVQPIGRGLRVVGPDGRRVDHGQVRVAGAEVAVDVDARAPGTYRVVWSVISPDTHPDFGTMTFSVRRPGGVIAEGTPAGGDAAIWGAVLGALAHFLHFAGYALGFGALAAAWLTDRADRPSGIVEAPDALWRLTGVGIALLLAAEPVAFAAESIALGAVGGGSDPAVVGAVLDSSFGRVLSQRLAAAILLWVLAGALRSGALRAAWTVPLLGAALAFVDGQAAHATSVRPAWWGLAVNTIHVGAMGLWGGTLALVLLSRRHMPASSVTPPAPVKLLALAAGVAAVASGAVMAFQHLSGLRDFVASPYGRTLAMKICAVAAVAGLGWFGVRRAAAPRLLAWDAAMMLVVLALAGVLVLLRPPVP